MCELWNGPKHVVAHINAVLILSVIKIGIPDHVHIEQWAHKTKIKSKMSGKSSLVGKQAKNIRKFKELEVKIALKTEKSWLKFW